MKKKLEEIDEVQSLQDFLMIVNGKQVCAGCKTVLTEEEAKQLPYVSQLQQKLEQTKKEEIKRLDQIIDYKQRDWENLNKLYQELIRNYDTYLNLEHVQITLKKEREDLLQLQEKKAKLVKILEPLINLNDMIASEKSLKFRIDYFQEQHDKIEEKYEKVREKRKEIVELTKKEYKKLKEVKKDVQSYKYLKNFLEHNHWPDISWAKNCQIPFQKSTKEPCNRITSHTCPICELYFCGLHMKHHDCQGKIITEVDNFMKELDWHWEY